MIFISFKENLSSLKYTIFYHSINVSLKTDDMLTPNFPNIQNKVIYKSIPFQKLTVSIQEFSSLIKLTCKKVNFFDN